MLLYGKEPMKISYHPTKFGGHKDCGGEDIMILQNVILQNHVIKRSCEFEVGYHPDKFGSHRHSDS